MSQPDPRPQSPQSHAHASSPPSSAPPSSAPSLELHRLLSALADDALSDEEFARLDTLLRDDPQARKTYVRYVNLCALLGDLVVPSFSEMGESEMGEPEMGESEMGESEMGESEMGESEMGEPEIREIGRRPPRLPAPGRRRYFGRPQMQLAAACAALLAIAAGFLFFNRQVTPEMPATIAADGDGSAHVAVITAADGAKWAPGSPAAGVGAALGLQTITLSAGRLEVDFGCGAKVYLRGPAEFSLLSASRGALRYGDLSASVPDGAEQFVIDTPSVEVVDLGTEFGVSVSRAGIADVHVFKGAVEARTTGADETPGSLFRLATRQTRRFAPDAAAPTETTYRPDEFPSIWESSGREPQTRGAIRLLRHAPASVEADTLESNEFMLLFLERSDVALRRPLPLTIGEPGRYTQFRGRSKRLPAGVRVSSYLLHFDSVMRNGRPRKLRLDGSVTFAGPILGVIAAGKPLLISDALLGHPQTIYGVAGPRGLDSRAKDDALDVVTLSDDRRTLDVSFSVRKSSDQLRVLIAAPEPPDAPQPNGFGI